MLKLILAGSAAFARPGSVRTAVQPSSLLRARMTTTDASGSVALGGAEGVEVGLRAQLDAAHAEGSAMIDELRRLRREVHHLQQRELAGGQSESLGAAGGQLLLRVPVGFSPPDWWACASEAETARALMLLPPLLQFIGGQEDEKMRQVLSLESRLAGVDDGARAAVKFATGAVEDVWRGSVGTLEEAWRGRVGSLEAVAESTAASARKDREALVRAYEERIIAVDAARGATMGSTQAALRSAQDESAAARADMAAVRAALSQAFEASQAENSRLHARVAAAEAAVKVAEVEALEAAARGSPLISPQSLGAVREAEVEKVIASVLVCSVEDVSHLSGAGDRLITTPDGMRMLQETKAKERLSAQLDINRFKADVEKSAAEGRVNAGLFVSLKTSTLPNAGQYAVEWLNVDTRSVGSAAQHAGAGAAGGGLVRKQVRQVPIVMVATANRDSIALAAQALHWMCIRAREAEAAAAAGADDESDEMRALMGERRALAEALPPIFSLVEKAACEIDERLRLLRKLVDLAEADKTRHGSLEMLIQRLSGAVPFVCAPHAAASADRELAVGLVVDFMTKNDGQAPKVTQFTLAERKLLTAAGGIGSINRIARERLKAK